MRSHETAQVTFETPEIPAFEPTIRRTVAEFLSDRGDHVFRHFASRPGFLVNRSDGRSCDNLLTDGRKHSTKPDKCVGYRFSFTIGNSPQFSKIV